MGGASAAAKTAMVEGGVIACDAVRHPLAPPPAVRAGMLELVHDLDPIVLRWGK